MKVLDSHKKEAVNETIIQNIDEESIIFSDKCTSYVDISERFETNIIEKSSRETTNTTLKWVHIAISNAKLNLFGAYHKVIGKYIQLYLGSAEKLKTLGISMF